MKRIIFSLALILFPVILSAQGKIVVSGTVRDTKGEPVVGAMIMVEGNTATGTVSDLEGNYTISVTPSDSKPKLVFSCLSYQTVTIDIDGRTKIDIVLPDDAEQLEEVVVIGYGSMRKSDLTGSVTSVKIDDMESAQSSSLDQLLQGNAAGVNIINNSASPDAGVTVQIRGASSFSSTDPLYVVDGVIMNTGTSMSLLTAHSGADNSGSDEETNGLMGINPQDIASIEVLKDASATAIYGSQGANGVVLITTKKANTDQPRIRVSLGLDVLTPYKKMDIMSYEDYVNYLLAMESQTLSPLMSSDAATRLTTITSGRIIPIDWQNYVMRNTVSERFYLSVSGKPKKTNYLFSVGVNDARGIIRNTGFQNYTARLNLDRELGRSIKVGAKLSASFLRSQLTQGASFGTLTTATSLMRSMVSSAPYTYKKITDDEGDYIDIDTDDKTYMAGPDRWLTGFTNNKTEYRINPSVYFNATIIKGLTFNTQFGADYRVTEQAKFKSALLSWDASGATAAIGTVERLNWNWDSLLNYDRKFRNRHSINATLGMSMSYDGLSAQTTEGINIDEWKAQEHSLNSAAYSWFTFDETKSTMMSWFVRGIYNYRDRYIVTATWRIDGSSRFAGKNKWANFPSFAAAWRINQEPWFKVKTISMLKLRVGWGQVGKQAAQPYATTVNYTTGYFPSHEADAQKILVTMTKNFPNKDLKWETTEQTNIGIDLGLWQGRLTFTAEAYYKKTKDLLQQPTIAGSAGLQSPFVNMGSIENKGLEFTVDAVPLKINDFEWTIGGNLSLNKNKILSINPAGTSSGNIWLSPGNRRYVEYFDGDIIGSGDVLKSTLNIFVQGQPMSQFYGLLCDGLVQEGETGVPYGDGNTYRGPGAVNYVDLNEDGIIDDSDRTIIGDPNPDFTYGFNTSFSWKRLRFTANFIGSYGNDIYNINRMMDTNTSNVNRNVQRSVVTSAWTPENTNTWYPALGAMSGADVKLPSSRYVEDGSFLRLSNVSLSYTFVFQKKDKALFLRNMTIGASAGNLWVWTKYSGWDPNVNSYGNIKKRGADMGSYPGARSFKFDLKFTF